MPDLFSNLRSDGREHEQLTEGAFLLRRFAQPDAPRLIEALENISSRAPWRHMITPTGHRMSVAMTNCGHAGWVSDKQGYRYQATDPLTGGAWPVMPECFFSLANRAAAASGFEDFRPDVCLVNRYEPGARLTLHQDRDERDFGQPIVSVSLGLPAKFLFGGLSRKDRVRRIRLESGDVVVWGGPARLVYHGIAPLAGGEDPLTGACRINLTFRKAL
jgi:alkylated DNA repair protein (DNA oxidative demethylase)